MKTICYPVLACAMSILPIATVADSAASKTFVMETLQEALVKANPDVVPQYWAPNYIQHNPNIGNGMEHQKGLIQYLAGSGTFGAEYARVIADDDNVAVHARYTGFGPTATIALDVFRVEDGLIVAHRDVIAPMPGPDAQDNQAGKF